MTKMTALKAKTNFGDVLDRVERGEQIVITRHDKPVARVIPEGAANRREIRKAVEGLQALQACIARRSKGKPPLTETDIRSAIEAGRS